MMSRKTFAPSKATPYRGNGKFGLSFGGCMFERPMTPEEEIIAKRIHERYDQNLGFFYIAAGTNRGKPYWLIQIAQGYDVDSTVSMDDLEKEMDKWFQDHLRMGVIR